MARVSNVIVADGTGPVSEAIDKLAALAQKGLIDPLWFVDSVMRRTRPWPATYLSKSGKEEVALFSSLGQFEAERIRIAAIASPGDDVASGKLAEVADTVRDQIGSLAPSDSAVKEARIWFPDWELMAPPDESFFVPKVHSNLVVIPEDRRSDDHIAAPITPADGAAFAGHVASELCVLLGLFKGMEESPLDNMNPGVIFGSNPKVRLVRSFVRIGRSPELPIQDIVEHEGRLPVPPGTVEAPSPQAAVSEMARQSDVLFEGLVFEVREPDALKRLQMTPGETALLVLREMVSFIGSLPRRAASGVLEDFSELAGRTMQDLVGSSSVVEVVWKGKLASLSEGSEDYATLVDDMRREAVRRLDLQGGPSIDQTIWRDLSALVLAAVDGGTLPVGVEPIEIHGRRAVINDALSIAPKPQASLVDTAASILDESESETPASLIGRIGAKVERIAVSNRNSMGELLKRLEEDISKLAAYRPPTLAFWHLSGAVLMAGFLISALLFSGAVRGIGITEMSYPVRTLVYVILTLGALWFLYLFRSFSRVALQEESKKGAHSEPSEKKPKVGWRETFIGAGIGVGVSGLFIGFGVAALGYPATEPATYAALLTGAVTGAGLGQALMLGELQRVSIPAGRMARISIITVLVYVSILLIGAVAQPEGWYATASGSEIRSWLWPVCGTLLLMLILVVGYVSWRRVRERLLLSAIGFDIRQLAEQVGASLAGDRVADAAREQFLGLSAVLSRFIWHPYGKTVHDDIEEMTVESFGVNKAAICDFGLSDRGERLFSARTKFLASERGWLGAQYEMSVLSFREDLAVLLGADDLDSIGRPDEDPASVSHYDMDARAEKGDRWGWADDLFAGAFDKGLMETLELHGDEEVFTPILSDSENFVATGGCSQDISLLAFNAEILADGPTTADTRYFDPDQLAQAQFSREWRSQIWWPQEKLFAEAGSGVLHAIEPIGSLARGRTWIALRSDMTEDLQPAALFGETHDKHELTDTAGPDF